MAVSRSDGELLGLQIRRIGTARISKIDCRWVEKWITDMKRVHALAPSTIRHHAGAVARCLDWLARRHAEIFPGNPLRSLPRGYSAYSDSDGEVAIVNGKAPREDTERDRGPRHRRAWRAPSGRPPLPSARPGWAAGRSDTRPLRRQSASTRLRRAPACRADRRREEDRAAPPAGRLRPRHRRHGPAASSRASGRSAPANRTRATKIVFIIVVQRGFHPVAGHGAITCSIARRGAAGIASVG